MSVCGHADTGATPQRLGLTSSRLSEILERLHVPSCAERRRIELGSGGIVCSSDWTGCGVLPGETLRRFLDRAKCLDPDITHYGVARLLGTSRGHLSILARPRSQDGRQERPVNPELGLRQAIERFTGGVVCAADWDSEEVRSALARVPVFVPPSAGEG
jgi:hypothetical protein